MRQLIEDLISAMEYHVEQTRPIHSTTVALQAAREAIRAKPAPVESVAVKHMRGWVETLKRQSDYGQHMRIPGLNAGACFELAIELEQFINTTPPAAPDLQAELDATNRQVEILSDALSESQREVAALKAVQEPVAIYQYQRANGSWIDQDKFSYDYNVRLDQATVRIVYTTPPAAKRPWVGLTEHELESLWYQAETGGAMLLRFAEAIEAKLKERNT